MNDSAKASLNAQNFLSVDFSLDNHDDDMVEYREGALKEILLTLVFRFQSDLTLTSTFPVWSKALFFIKIKPLIYKNIDSGLFDIPPPHAG